MGAGHTRESDPLAWFTRPYKRRQVLQAGLSMTAGGVLLSSGLMSALLAACTNSSPQTGGATPQRGGILRLGLNSFDATQVPDPALSSGIAVEILAWLVYDSLTIAGLDGVTVQPNLATKWQANSDVTQWTFTLRSDVKFHDGTPMTSADVAWTLKRILDPKLGAILAGRLAPSFDATGVTTPDDHTLVLTLKRPDADLPWVLGSPGARICKNGTAPITTAAQAIGTGPFKVVSFTGGESWEITRNPNFWIQGQPYLDGIRASLFSETATLLAAIQSGSVDVTSALDASSVSALQGNATVKVIADKNSRFFNIAMDPDQKPFTDPNVTRAFKLAVDRNKILQTVFQGGGSVTADVPVPVTSPVYPHAIGSGAQDINQAKSLLAAAGYPNGVDVVLTTAPQTGGMVDLAVAFADTVKDAGIRVKVNTLSNADYGAEVGSKTLMYTDWWYVSDPLQILSIMYVSTGFGNEAKLNDPHLDSLVSQALGTSDPSARSRILEQTLQLGASEASQVIPVIVDQQFGTSTKVHGVQPNGIVLLDLRTAWIG